MSDEEQRRYRDEFLASDPNREGIMGFTSTIREQGRQENRIHTLQRLLEKRFGPQPTTLRERLSSASAEQLDAWILRVLDAESAEEVFETSADGH